jgi:hypothetical protein
LLLQALVNIVGHNSWIHDYVRLVVHGDHVWILVVVEAAPGVVGRPLLLAGARAWAVVGGPLLLAGVKQPIEGVCQPTKIKLREE